MSYRLTNDQAVVRLADNASIPADTSNRDYQEYLEWLDEGNTPDPAPTVAPATDWRGFLAAMKGTTAFAAVRGQARLDVAANAVATELRTLLGEAALGLAEAAEIQGVLDELLPVLTAQQVAEIDAGIAAFNLPLTTA